MIVKMRKPSEEKIKACGWEYIGTDMSDNVTYSKEIKNKESHLTIYSHEIPDLSTGIYYDDIPTVDELIAISNELKRLEDN